MSLHVRGEHLACFEAQVKGRQVAWKRVLRPSSAPKGYEICDPTQEERAVVRLGFACCLLYAFLRS